MILSQKPKSPEEFLSFSQLHSHVKWFLSPVYPPLRHSLSLSAYYPFCCHFVSLLPLTQDSHKHSVTCFLASPFHSVQPDRVLSIHQTHQWFPAFFSSSFGAPACQPDCTHTAVLLSLVLSHFKDCECASFSGDLFQTAPERALLTTLSQQFSVN